MNEEFDPNEEFDQGEDEYTRRVHREVVRPNPLEDEVYTSEDEEELTPEEQERERRAEERRLQREANPVWQFVSGNWLVNEGVAEAYRYLILVAIALFLSVVTIFYSFHVDEVYYHKLNRVQLLRERSLEYQRVKFSRTSHSAIVKMLRESNIPLYELQESKVIIE